MHSRVHLVDMLKNLETCFIIFSIYKMKSLPLKKETVQLKMCYFLKTVKTQTQGVIWFTVVFPWQQKLIS